MGRVKKTRTPAEISEAARLSVMVRHHGPKAAAKKKPTVPSPPATGSAMLPGFNDYDAAVAANRITYSEARVREQVREQEILNSIKSMELDRQRGKLITAEDMRAKLELVRDAIEAEGKRLVEPLVALFPPEQKSPAAKSIGLAVERMRIAMADHLDRAGGTDAG